MNDEQGYPGRLLPQLPGSKKIGGGPIDPAAGRPPTWIQNENNAWKESTEQGAYGVTVHLLTSTASTA